LRWTMTRGIMLMFRCSQATEDLTDRQGSGGPSLLPLVEAYFGPLRVKGGGKVNELSGV
ncbi:hypothetical protein HAX54_052922, partial [Datura stramonium]|nr:hypothetical protein [Datura stramonium]